MDTRTGEIISMQEAERRNREFGLGTAVPMLIPPTMAQFKRRKVGRNDPCPCGSGNKFKRCCIRKGSIRASP